MRKSDPRYDEEDDALMVGRQPRYLHRKPSKAAKQTYAIGEVVSSNPVARSLLANPAAQTVAAATTAAALRKATPKLLGVARKGAVALGTFALDYGILGVGIVAAAGLSSYFATKYILEHYPTKQRRLNAAADAYRKSRRDLAATLGRALTAAELKQLADHYKSVVAAINR